MVCLKQLSITAAVVLSIAESAAAAPIPSTVEERALKNIGGKFDRLVNSGNLGMSIYSAVTSKRDLEDRDFEEKLDERDIEELYERDLEERARVTKKVATKKGGSQKSAIPEGFGKGYDRALDTAEFALDVYNSVKPKRSLEARKFKVTAKNAGKGFDRVVDTGTLGMSIYDAVVPKRDLEGREEELYERDLEEEFDERDFEEELYERNIKERAIKNIGGKFDRLVNTGNLGMSIYSAATAKREIEELEERAFEDYLLERYL